MNKDLPLVQRLLDNKIRYGTEPDNPALLALWLNVQTYPHASVIEQRAHYEQQFYLLLEAVVDELVPRQWRRMCLDNIYRPLCNLNRLANGYTEKLQVRQLMQELSVSSRYVEASLKL